jgi:hypothetical protein
MDPNNFGIQRTALPAWVELCAAQDDNPSYPCSSNPFFYMDYDNWDEDKAIVLQQEDADALCYGCPIIKQCYEFAIANSEQHGVWGGVLFGVEDKLF